MTTYLTVFQADPRRKVEFYRLDIPLETMMRKLDPHDMGHWIDENTGMMPKDAPCFHDITRGPLWDTEVRRICGSFARSIQYRSVPWFWEYDSTYVPWTSES